MSFSIDDFIVIASVVGSFLGNIMDVEFFSFLTAPFLSVRFFWLFLSRSVAKGLIMGSGLFVVFANSFFEIAGIFLIILWLLFYFIFKILF